MKLSKKAFICFIILSLIMIYVKVVYAASVTFSLNETSKFIGGTDGTFEFQIRVTDMESNATSISGTMEFNSDEIRIDAISGISSNWQLAGRNLTTGTFYLIRSGDASGSNESIINVKGTVLKQECETSIIVKELEYMDRNDVQIDSNVVLNYFIKRIKPIEIEIKDDDLQSGIGDSNEIVNGNNPTEDDNSTNNGGNNNTNGNNNGNTAGNTNGNTEGNANGNDKPISDSENGNNLIPNGNENSNQNNNNLGNEFPEIEEDNNLSNGTNNNLQGGNQNSGNQQGTPSQKDPTITPADRAPQTGTSGIIVIALGATVLVGILCYIGFRKNSY